MTWFSTKAFEFTLPGDGWTEETTQFHRPKGDDRTAFAISRQKATPDLDLETTVREMKGGLYKEREIVRSEGVRVGPLDAHDVGVIARNYEHADYHRNVAVLYFDLALNFQWVGPAASREEIDVRADRTLATLKFRKR